MRRAKSFRIGVHIANAVVWGPVYRTRLSLRADVRHSPPRSDARRDAPPAPAARDARGVVVLPSGGVLSETRRRRRLVVVVVVVVGVCLVLVVQLVPFHPRGDEVPVRALLRAVPCVSARIIGQSKGTHRSNVETERRAGEKQTCTRCAPLWRPSASSTRRAKSCAAVTPPGTPPRIGPTPRTRAPRRRRRRGTPRRAPTRSRCRAPRRGARRRRR